VGLYHRTGDREFYTVATRTREKAPASIPEGKSRLNKLYFAKQYAIKFGAVEANELKILGG
jgi:hypothetical protein